MAGVRLKVQILLHKFSFWEDFFFFFFGAAPEHRTDEAACISEEQRCRRHDMVPAMFDEIESLGFFSFVLAALYKLLHYASQTDHNAKVVLKQSKKKTQKKPNNPTLLLKVKKDKVSLGPAVVITAVAVCLGHFRSSSLRSSFATD